MYINSFHQWLFTVSKIVVVCIFISGCRLNSFRDDLDVYLFQRFGVTMLTHLDKVTIKEIHLDSTSFANRDIVVVGKFEELAPYKTYLVLSDESGSKMIVNLSNVYEVLDKNSISLQKGDELMIWGRIETAQKGLPFIKAMSVNSKKN